MTTKRERGRDPEQHVTHAGISAADNFIGMHGELTMVAEGGSDHAHVIQLRAHNGIEAGGYVVPVIPATEPRAPLTFASVPPEFNAPGASLLVTHELGYKPLVQVLDADGIVIPQVSISVVTTPTNGAGPASNGTNDHTHSDIVLPIQAVTQVVNWSVEHHDDENFTFVNNTGDPVALIIR